jgi:hypothetical protein
LVPSKKPKEKARFGYNKYFDDWAERDLTDGYYESSYDNAGVRISARDSWRLTKTLPFLSCMFDLRLFARLRSELPLLMTYKQRRARRI